MNFLFASFCLVLFTCAIAAPSPAGDKEPRALATPPVKLAVVGDRNLCDRITAELSGTGEFDLLERTEIDKVLNEHKLSDSALTAGVLKKYFPHTVLFAVVGEKRLVVFHAENGFRLRDDDSSDDAAGKIVEAKRKLMVANPLYLSIVSVRDVGVPHRDKPKIEEFTRAFEQHLMKHPDIQMLERSRLSWVNEERELTRRFHKLKASVRLLALEFEPGGEAKMIHVKLVIRDLSSQILGRTGLPDAFEDIPKASELLGKKTFAILIRPREDADSDTKREAIRFFREYQALTGSKTAKIEERSARINAALALDPGNPEYRYAEIQLEAERIGTLPRDERLKEYPLQWERCRKFRDEFPESGFGASYATTSLRWELDRKLRGRPLKLQPGVIHTMYVLPGLNRRDPRETEAARPILAQMRRYAESENRLWFPCSPEDGINSLLELANYGRTLYRTCSTLHYISLKECLLGQLQSELLFYRAAEELAEKHPEETEKIRRLIEREGPVRAADVTKNAYAFPENNKLEIIREYLESKELDEFIQFARKSRFTLLRQQAMTFSCMRDLIKARENATAVSGILEEYFSSLDQSFPDKVAQSSKPGVRDSGSGATLAFNFEEFLGFLTGNNHFFRDEERKYREKNHTPSDWAKFEDAVKNETAEELLAYVPVMRRNNYARITHLKTRNLYIEVIGKIFARDGKFISPAAEKLFFSANADFEIQSHPYSAAGSDIEILLGAARHETETVLLFQLRRHSNLHLAFLRADGSMSPLIRTPVPKGKFHVQGFLAYRRSPPITFDGKAIALADTDGNVHLFTCSINKWDFFEGAAPQGAASLLIAMNRIWVLSGGHLWNSEFCALISIHPESGTRETHFSTARTDPQNELDSIPIRELNTLLLFDKKLYFTVTTRSNTMVYRFDPESGAFVRIVKFPFSGNGIDRLWFQDGALYCFTFSQGERIYRIHPEKKEAEWIFTQTGKRTRFDSPGEHPVVLRGAWLLNAPWLFHDKMLYCANYTPGAIRPDHPETSPLLLLPPCIHLFENKESVLFLGLHRYFIVKEKMP